MICDVGMHKPNQKLWKYKIQEMFFSNKSINQIKHLTNIYRIQFSKMDHRYYCGY